MTLAPGTRLGAYHILSAVGAGGMGEVYKARDTKLDRDVAVKVLPPAFAADSDRIARLEREAKTLASLNHPNIAHIYGLEDSTSPPALVMEFVEGPTLADRIARGAIPLDEALPIARQIADALEAAHDHGIIHRDLKPANIKVRDDGTVKVLDFGLAKALDPSSGSGLQTGALANSPTLTSPPLMTGVGTLIGTAAYMSPEQARGRIVDKRTDIWAFGAVLYEMLTGRRAFDGDDATEMIAAVVKTTPDWSALPPDAPAPLVTLIQKCLEKDQRARVSDIAVARFLLSESGTLPHMGAIPAPTTSSPSWRAAAPWALAGVFLLTIVVVSFRLFRETPSTQPSIRFQVAAPDNTTVGPFRLSPDGRRLALVVRTAGTTQVWIRSFDSLTAVPLAGTDGGTYPFWSADGTQIGFFAQGKLKRIAASGGLALTVCDAVSGRGGAWNRDGVMLFAPDISGGLYRVAETGGTPVAVTTVAQDAAGGGDRFPEFLPDGGRFLFLRTSTTDSGLYGGTLSGGAIVRILPDTTNAVYVRGPGEDGFLLFRRDNALMAQPFNPTRLETAGSVMPIAEQVGLAGQVGYGAFTASQDGTVAYRTGFRGGSRQLVWLDRSGRRLESIANPDEISLPSLSPDGQAVVFSVGDPTAGTSDLWRQDLPGGSPYRLTWGAQASDPTWSPDNSRIAFTGSTRANGVGDQIQQMSAKEPDRPKVLLGGNYSSIQVSDWSPDNKLIAFSSRSAKTKDDLWLLSPGDRKPTVFLQTPANEQAGRFSPSGEWMAYQSDAFGGRYEIFVQHVPDARKFPIQVSASGGTGAEWSRDGSELFYIEGGRKVMKVSVKAGATFEHGQAQFLFDDARLAGDVPVHGAVVIPSRNGQRFLALERAEEGSEPQAITVVTNWLTTLKTSK
jgi:serine/threonine protein kinase/Tol biopolymer transport system component